MARLPRRCAKVQNPSIPLLSNFQYTAEQHNKMETDHILYIHKKLKNFQSYVTPNTYNTLEDCVIIINNIF